MAAEGPTEGARGGVRIEYASSNVDSRGAPPRIDYLVLVLSVLPAGLAFVALVFEATSHGYYELSGSWSVRVAWRVQSAEVLVWAWLAFAVACVWAATRPPQRRTRWYSSLVIVWVVAVFGVVASLAVTDGANFKYRWVSTRSGKPVPQSWGSHFVELDAYWQFPVVMTIANPAVILIAVRLLRESLLTLAADSD
jgi:hypothetical protein